jgi:hypothetical protein
MDPCSNLLAMSNHEFSDLLRQLEKTISQLKETFDPQIRRTMLADVARLLAEADRLLSRRQTEKPGR